MKMKEIGPKEDSRVPSLLTLSQFESFKHVEPPLCGADASFSVKNNVEKILCRKTFLFGMISGEMVCPE